jgi:hypothetical protein
MENEEPAARLARIRAGVEHHREYLEDARKGRARLGMQQGVTRASPETLNLLMAKAPAAAVGVPAHRTFTLVAQGDSWFNYWIGKDILHWLDHDYGHRIFNIAVAGSTLNDEVYGPVPSDFLDFRQIDAPSRLLELVHYLDQHSPDALLLSAGGNDVAGDEFFSFVNNAKSGLTPLNSGVLSAVISPTFEKAYRDMIDAALATSPNLKIFTHGYDYPWPDGRGVLWLKGAIGPWFDKTFNEKNFPNTSFSELKTRHDIVMQFVDALNQMLKSLEAAYPGRVFHIDLRGTLKSNTATTYRDDWANELHPTDVGFKALTVLFNNSLQANI